MMGEKLKYSIQCSKKYEDLLCFEIINSNKKYHRISFSRNLNSVSKSKIVYRDVKAETRYPKFIR